MAIAEDDNTASLELAFAAAGCFELRDGQARATAGGVAAVIAEWRAEAARHGLSRQEIGRMASAFERENVARARGR